MTRERHGMHGTPVYFVWKTMRQRCTNPRDSKWSRYGGRGIKVCDRWGKFSAFLADMGYPPKGMTLDRINVNGNYEPGNCRWATPFQQAVNRDAASNSKTGVKGVSYLLRKKVWRYCAHITAGGVRRHLGYFDNFFDACCARKSAEVVLHHR